MKYQFPSQPVIKTIFRLRDPSDGIFRAGELRADDWEGGCFAGLKGSVKFGGEGD